MPWLGKTIGEKMPFFIHMYSAGIWTLNISLALAWQVNEPIHHWDHYLLTCYTSGMLMLFGKANKLMFIQQDEQVEWVWDLNSQLFNWMLSDQTTIPIRQLQVYTDPYMNIASPNLLYIGVIQHTNVIPYNKQIALRIANTVVGIWTLNLSTECQVTKPLYQLQVHVYTDSYMYINIASPILLYIHVQVIVHTNVIPYSEQTALGIGSIVEWDWEVLYYMWLHSVFAGAPEAAYLIRWRQWEGQQQKRHIICHFPFLGFYMNPALYFGSENGQYILHAVE